MEFKDVVSRRQSCRRYLEKPVEREKLLEIARAGRLSPSACNSQRWVFIVVDETHRCAALSQALVDEALHVNTFTAKIPAYIVLVKHPPRAMNERQCKLLGGGEDWSMLDIGIAAQQMHLAATDLGLGSVMLGWYKPDLVRSALDIPPELEPALLIGVGYPESDVIKEKARYGESEIIRVNSYGGQA